MQLWFGTWDGVFQRVNARWPRFYTEQQELVLTFAEAELQSVQRERQRAEEAERRAERLAAKFREPGVTEESL